MSFHLPHWFDKAAHTAVEAAGVIVAKKGGAVLNLDGEKLPHWFDVARHILSSAGILDAETGLHLASDGHPVAGAARAIALAAAGIAEDKLELVASDAIENAYARLTAEKAAAEAPPEKSKSVTPVSDAPIPAGGAAETQKQEG